MIQGKISLLNLNLTPALAFFGIDLTTPRPTQLIENPQTIGEHIKKRRQELNKTQREVSLGICVSEDTITYWENGRSKPQIHHYPAIIQFLGYSPFEIDTGTIGRQIKKYRYEHGLTFRQLAKLTGFDPGSLERWEKGTQKPLPKTLKLLEQIFTTKESS